MKIFILLLALCSVTAVADEWQTQQIDANLSFRGSAAADGIMWVSGSNNSVFLSKDSGKTWLDVSIKDQPLTDFRDIEVFDANTAIVMGAGGGALSKLYLTEDQGASWKLLLENKHETGFFDSIAFWDRNNGLLLGDPVDGCFVILRTRDGGKSWQRIARGKLPELLDREVAFAASGNTLMVGEAGQAWFTTGGHSSSIYTSQDFGEYWQRTHIPLYDDTQTAGGYGLAMNSLNDVFVVGGDYQQRDKHDANMVYLKGKVWHKTRKSTAGLRTAMVCHLATCIASGKLAMDISYDHGFSWQPLSVKGQIQGYYTLAIDDDTVVAAGHNGRVAVYVVPQAD
ncbi:oxidoreductase [Shewanella abyssi]|uniref:WD40/YVTN/BNR-like repeat-containing protein n=1 Tax=Shewanella abyssi TaxID=311789 RepID=UPI00200D6779|nr:oxidoreductase [Shewanella abyssi]MCL1050050.1 oxidoreductase [Shewanella abyssi]